MVLEDAPSGQGADGGTASAGVAELATAGSCEAVSGPGDEASPSSRWRAALRGSHRLPKTRFLFSYENLLEKENQRAELTVQGIPILLQA